MLGHKHTKVFKEINHAKLEANPNQTLNKDSNHHLNKLLFAVSIGAFISHFSAGLINVALPDIALDFNQSLDYTQWLVSGYLMSVLLCLPVLGKLADTFGKRMVHNLGYVVFGIATIFAALSSTILWLLIFRILQGVGAAMLQSANMGIITTALPKESRGRALGFLSMAVAFGGLLGPSAGGVIIEWFSWPVLFWIQTPLLVVALFLAHRYIPKDLKRKKESFDTKGMLLYSVSIFSFVYTLSYLEDLSYLMLVLLSLVILTFIFLFLNHYKKVSNPLIDLAFLSLPIVRGGIIISITSFAAVFSLMVAFPFYLRGIMEISPAVVGLIMVSYPLFMAITGPISGTLSDQYGSIKIASIGLACMSLSFLGLSLLVSTSSISMIIVLLCVLGISMGMVTTPNYNLIMGYVPPSFSGMMGSFIALCRNLGMLTGTTLGLTVINLWIPGTISDWMSGNSYNAELSQVTVGFKGLYWINVSTIFLSLTYLLMVRKMENTKFGNKDNCNSENNNKALQEKTRTIN